MPAYYSIVQYTPDPVIDERINIGVVAFGDGTVRARFLQHWGRARLFGADVAGLKAFAKEAEQMSEEAIRKAAGHWRNCIQFTQPAASLLDTQALLENAALRFLASTPPADRQHRTRQAAIALARRTIKAALRSRLGRRAKGLLHEHYNIDGALDHHEFDLGVGNGHPFFAVQGLSFEGQATKDLAKDVHATAFSIEDIRRKGERFPLSVVALPPKGSSDQYDRAVHAFREVGAEVVPESGVEDWAARMAEEVVV